MAAALPTAVLFVVVITAFSADAAPVLRFNDDFKFKIVQFTDLHFGEGENQWWGPWQDENSKIVMSTILEIENPDLVVLTGDLITGNNIVDNATAYWKEMVSPMVAAKVPWAVAFGNHDSLASGKGGSRVDLMLYDMTFPWSVSQFGPANIHGVSNYVVKILNSPQHIRPEGTASLLWMLDSGESGCLGEEGSGCIFPDQVQWYLELSQQFQRAAGHVVPSYAFFHIPLQEYLDVWNTQDCYGWNNDSVTCQALNTGFFAAMKQSQDIRGVFVGHDHGNDFCGMYSGIELCFGRHSGYGGYGDWERGARVIELTQNTTSSTIEMNTWIRFEHGEKEDQGGVHPPKAPFQLSCNS